MQNNCWMGLLGDWTMPAELDVMLRGTAARNQATCRQISGSLVMLLLPSEKINHRQVSVEKLNVVGFVDLTKIGVITQKDLNKVGAWCDRLIAKNPLSSLAASACLPLTEFHHVAKQTFELLLRHLCCHGPSAVGICNWMWGPADRYPESQLHNISLLIILSWHFSVAPALFFFHQEIGGQIE